MEFTVSFLKTFFYILYLSLPVVGIFAFVIVLLGQVVGKIEKWSNFDAFYWSFITATTVGYGDLHPHKKISRIFSIIIGLTGLMMTGIMITVAVQSGSIALKEHYDRTEIRSKIEQKLNNN